MGSFYLILTTLLLSFPTGVAAAVYLEEFAPRNRLTDWIEVNINNLAAVPSVVFGLLGLATFLNTLGLPRSAPFVGGLVLSLIILPTIIIAARAALKSVPPSIREAALGVGASKMQSVLHHVLPLAMPGIMTGTIIGMAHALGESAPLLMIGMVAFIVDIPSTPLDPATVLPVQVYLWSNSPERAFVERTSAAIMVLLVFLIVVNALAVILRKKFERQW
ncbi:MAG: phosphate ABC transporter membrane protein 2 PhoT family [Rhodospirillaceae bacterium]|nr:MAG: phosphate ABC transporter membrane protein 2 PhoT family [Rhodospirillaceae bacterium]